MCDQCAFANRGLDGKHAPHGLGDQCCWAIDPSTSTSTEVLNPKTALFFLSFIAQFVSPAKGHMTLQFLILGTISIVLNTAVDLVVIVFAGSLALKIARRPKLLERQRTASGVGMIGLGIYVAATE